MYMNVARLSTTDYECQLYYVLKLTIIVWVQNELFFDLFAPKCIGFQYEI